MKKIKTMIFTDKKFTSNDYAKHAKIKKHPAVELECTISLQKQYFIDVKKRKY
jgi:hypothetical protein